MAEDISPVLLRKVQKNFRDKLEKAGATKSEMLKRVRDGTIYSINQYTHKVGKSLAYAFLEELVPEALPNETLYYNIARKVMLPPIEEAHGMVSDVADELQTIKYKQMGLGLKPIRPPIQMDRFDGILDLLTEGAYVDNLHYLNEPIRNLVDHFGDYHVEKNTEFMSSSGVDFSITRVAERTSCDWCAEREGTYSSYAEAQANDVFARHEGCRCELVIKGRGSSGKMRARGRGFARTT